MSERKSGIVGVVALLVAALAVFAMSAASPAPEAIDLKPDVVPSSSVQLSCPESPANRRESTSMFAVAPPGGQTTGDRANGSLIASPLSSSARDAVGTSDEVGVPVSTPLRRADKPSITVTGKGGLAAGAFAGQESVFDDQRVSGLAVSACQQPADSWWLNAVDTSVGSTARLVLSNPTPAVAVVDLKFYGPDGPVNAVGARGIPLAPHSRDSVDLARFAPGLDGLTLHVLAERGRVTAAVNVSRVNGATPAGNDWISPADEPSTDLVVNAGDGGPGDQRLVVTNPGRRDALVQVRVLGESGPFTPTGLKDLEIKPSRSRMLNISGITDSTSAALNVTSTVEVTAATVSERSRNPLDFTVTTSSPALREPAVVPVFSGTTGTLAFTTVKDGGGRVELEMYDDNGDSLGTEPVNVRAGATAIWSDKLPRRTAYLVVTVRDGAGLQGVVTYHNGAGLASMPIVSGEWTVSRPAVRPAP